MESKDIQQCIEPMNTAGALGRIELKWIKAHRGLLDNELADEAAKLGALEEGADKVQCPRAKGLIKTTVNQAVIKCRNEAWMKSKQCRQTKIFFPEVSQKKAKTCLGTPGKSTAPW